MAQVSINVRVQPRARRDELVGVRDRVLVIRVRAPAIDGRANDGLCRFLADHVGVRRQCVTVIRGERAREKVVRIEADDPDAVRASLGL
jgi:uncharacterized protein (TIGR00251 family)